MSGSPSSDPLLHQPLADIVTADPRTAAVFDRRGLDYCCHGLQTLEEAAAAHGLPAADVLAELAALGPADPRDRAAMDWPQLDTLVAHIVTHHHAYVRGITPIISAWLDKLAARHGARHPELVEVRETFQALAEEMQAHMLKEETLLFPFIDALDAATRAGTWVPPGPFGTVMNPIRVMEHDHEQAGDALARLRQLTGGFTVPEDGCTTYRRCYAELARYEADLHRHVHLENNVLFPRAAELERRLS